MKRTTPIVLVVALLALLLSACAGSAPQQLATGVPPTQAPSTAVASKAAPTAAPTATATVAPITLTDSLGREVTLAAPAQRIVSIAPSNTEILFALGVADLLVARDEFSDFPAETAAIPSVGTGYPTLNTEAIVSYEPDLILAGGITSPDEVKALEQLGLTVYTTSIAGNLDDIYADITAVGQLTGRAEEAEEVVAGLKVRVDAVTAKTSALADKPVVFYEIDATEPAKPWTAGPNTFIDQLITLAGGVNAGNIATDQYAQLSLEALVDQDPDVIVLGSSTYGGQTPEMVAARAGWEGITAVKTGAVYSFDDNLVSRPGPRVVDGLEVLAKLIHPDLFK